MEFLKNPVQCPFCPDVFQLTPEQIAVLSGDGDKGLQIQSPTCGATAEVAVATRLVLDGSPQAMIGGSKGKLVQHANTRIFWNRVHTEPLNDLVAQVLTVNDGGDIGPGEPG